MIHSWSTEGQEPAGRGTDAGTPGSLCIIWNLGFRFLVLLVSYGELCKRRKRIGERQGVIRNPSVNCNLTVNQIWKTRTRAVEMAQTAKCLQCVHEDPRLDSSNTLQKPRMLGHSCSSSHGRQDFWS